MPPPDIFELFGPARYTPAGGATFHLRAMMASDAYERRIIARKRPYLDGAPLDDTGAEPDAIDITLLFAERDPGIPGVAERVYPQYHARFLRECRVEGTGTLYMPGRGERRVRLRRLSSQQTPQERDCETVTCSFLVDLEDGGRAGADTFNLPSSKSAGPVLVRQFAAAAAPGGLGGDLLTQLEDAVAQLEATVNAPFEAAADVARRADRVLDLCRRIRRLHTAPVVATANAFAPLRPPGAAEPLALLAQIEDVAAGQRAALFGAGSVRPRRFSRPMSIFEIAAQLGQPVDDLIRMNGSLPLFGIPPGVEVLTKAA